MRIVVFRWCMQQGAQRMGLDHAPAPSAGFGRLSGIVRVQIEIYGSVLKLWRNSRHYRNYHTGHCSDVVELGYR